MDNIPTKSEVTPEVKPEEKAPEYSYDEVHKEPIKEIAENKEIPEEKPEVKLEEKPPESPKPTVEEKEIEPEQLVEEISTKVAEKLTPKEEQEVKDKYTEFFDRIKEEKGRDPNWIELSKFLEEQAVLRVEEKQIELRKAEEEQKKEENKVNEAFTKRFNTQIDEEIEELYKSGNLTPIKDPKNPSDQGVIERKALFQAMLDTNQQRVSEGKDVILSIARIFYGGYYTKPNVQPPGSEAPISMGKGTPASEGGEQEVDYMKDIKKPWSFFQKRV